MSLINTAIKAELQKHRVEVFFVSRHVTKWWNARRQDPKTEIALLGGYYWCFGNEEVGPFRSPSAALRDAYYRRILKQSPPLMSKDEVTSALDEIERATQNERRKAARQAVRRYSAKLAASA
jgi:hypothetical protein